MHVARAVRQRVGSRLLLLTFVSLILLAQIPHHAGAATYLVQATNASPVKAASVSLAFAAGPAANDLLVAICGASTNSTITAPAGFSTAVNENAAGLVSQGIFYKVATGSEGTAALSCGGGTAGSTVWGMQLYEYRNTVTASPFDAKNAAASTGSSTTLNSGSVTTTNANDLIIAGGFSLTNTAFGAWTSSFTGQQSNQSNVGGTKVAFGGADRIVNATGTYSTTVPVGNASWRGQIAAFKIIPPVFSVDIVDGSGVSVASPTIAMSTKVINFKCGTSTGTFGISTQKIRVNNTTPADSNGWTLGLAANTSNWSDGSGHTYSYNNPAGLPAGCTAGQLTVIPTSEVITAGSGCTTTGVSALGSSTAFTSVVTSITIASAGATASYNCLWDITALTLSQTIPPSQHTGAYSIGFTLTLTAL